MSVRPNRTVALLAGLVALFVLLASACLWLIPKPHRQLDYMVAGAVATATTLAAGFSTLNWRGGKRGMALLRRVPVLRIRYVRRGSTVQ